MRVLLTGSNGVIGTVLSAGLPHAVTPFDLPENDARDYASLVDALAGHDAVIHLAWRMGHDGGDESERQATNALLTLNCCRAAVEAGVRRVVMASSVHADRFVDRRLDGLLEPYALPRPDSPYGAAKVFMEALGRHYADTQSLEVICVRFGGVNAADQPPEQPYSERQVWLSHRDCIDLVRRCVEAPTVPGGYAIVYAVSDNRDRLHDPSNPFGWQAGDGAR